jgi:hypothetical protein
MSVEWDDDEEECMEYFKTGKYSLSDDDDWYLINNI